MDIETIQHAETPLSEDKVIPSQLHVCAPLEDMSHLCIHLLIFTISGLFDCHGMTIACDASVLMTSLSITL